MGGEGNQQKRLIPYFRLSFPTPSHAIQNLLEIKFSRDAVFAYAPDSGRLICFD